MYTPKHVDEYIILASLTCSLLFFPDLQELFLHTKAQQHIATCPGGCEWTVWPELQQVASIHRLRLFLKSFCIVAYHPDFYRFDQVNNELQFCCLCCFHWCW